MNVRERLLEDLPVTERKARLDGVATALLEGGEGAPLVLLHGPGEQPAKFVQALRGALDN